MDEYDKRKIEVQMNRKILPLLFLMMVPMIFSCAEKRKYNLPVKTLVVNGAGGEVKVEAEIAIKTEERNYGFMNRKDIPDGTGMLFVFERDQILNFWMKNTPHPLSIAYIDASGVISDILDMTPFSEKSVPSSRSVRFALEVPQGWFNKVGIKVGDRVTCLENGESRDLKSIK